MRVSAPSRIGEELHKLHEHDIKLLVDLVVNHTSDEHPWFIEAKKPR